MKIRQYGVLAVSFLIIFGSVAIAAYLSTLKEPPKEKEQAMIRRYVRTTPVQYQDIETSVVAYGRVQTAQSLDLLSEVGGRMYEGAIRLKAGQAFKKGTLLFYIDDTEAELSLKSQKSTFMRDVAGILPDMQLDYPDSYPIWKDYFNGVKLDEDLPALPKIASEKEKTYLATKGIYSTFFNIKSAETRLKKHRYYAPFSGSISEVTLESGAFVSPGAKIGKIIRAGLHELQVSVETKDIPWIQVGSEASIYSDETKQTWAGRVLRISDFVNQSTQSVDVFIAIQPTGQRIYDGQFMQASVPARVVKDGMIIPRSAIYNGSEVFILEDTLLKTKSIDIVRLQRETAIFKGLEPGSDLVVEPLINAHNNMTAFKLQEKDIDLERKQQSEQNIVSNTSTRASSN
ncbi:MAG: HlyD family efflux transporter periplasmic adaptor subunit [Bacteroidota bacterium]